MTLRASNTHLQFTDYNIIDSIKTSYEKPLEEVVNQIFKNLKFKGASISAEKKEEIHNHFKNVALDSVEKIADNFSEGEKISANKLKKVFTKISQEKKWDLIIASDFLGIKNKPKSFFEKNWFKTN